MEDEMHAPWKPESGPRKPTRTKAAAPAKPAKPAAPIVSFATYAGSEAMLAAAYTKAAIALMGKQVSLAPRDPIPDYADIYWQPEDNPNAQRERAANENRRATLSARNGGKFGFHGSSDVKPVLRYAPDDFARMARRGKQQAPEVRANTSVASLNAYDQPITREERTLVVKRNVAPVQTPRQEGAAREPQRIPNASRGAR